MSESAESTEHYPERNYLNRIDEAETRRGAAYWNARFMAHLVAEAPGILWSELKAGVRWRISLLTGSIDTREEPCRLKGCDAQSVALLPSGDSYSDGTPACRRHYLLTKGVVYGVIAAIALVVAGAAWTVIA